MPTRSNLPYLLTINTSSTAYPSGSARHPTQIIPSNRSLPPPLLPLQHRQLPDLPNRRPIQLGIFLMIGLVWITFIEFSKNSEKFNSSIIKEILFELRNNEQVKKFLGLVGTSDDDDDDLVKPLRDVYFNQVWVDGHINLMQGVVDVAFRVTGSHHSGKVYFTSVRRDRESEFEIIRWKLIRDDGKVLDLLKGSLILPKEEQGQNPIDAIRTASTVDSQLNDAKLTKDLSSVRLV